MTLEERKAARKLIENIKAFEGKHPFAASPVTRNLEAALDQIDADEQRRTDDVELMRQAVEFVEMAACADNSGGEYDGQCQECRERMLLSKHLPGCRLNAALAALRTRLGEDTTCPK